MNEKKKDALIDEALKTPLDYVFNVNAYDVKNADALVQQTKKIQEHYNSHAREINHEVQAICIEFEKQLDTIDHPEQWIQELLWEKKLSGIEQQTSEPITVLRLKGILYPPKNKLDNNKKRMVIQGVQDLYDIQEGFTGDDVDANDTSSKIVLIGKNLNKEQISKSFSSVLSIEHKII